MASTDTRSGFRLPWSSDRSHDDTAPESAAAATTEPAEAPAPPAGSSWPEADTPAAHARDAAASPSLEADAPATPDPEEPGTMVELDTVDAQAPATPPKKPSKLMADLTAAIRATAESAREQALAQVDADMKQVVDAIREGSTEGAAALRHQSEEDITGIREWSKAEIARIREETERQITTRKATLDDELAGHAAAVERRVEEVRSEVARFETEMESYVERLLREDDPARLAAMAEMLPESPSFDAWANLETLDITLVPEAEADAGAEAPVAEPVDSWASAEAAAANPEAVLETTVSEDDPAAAVVEATEAPGVAEADPQGPADGGTGWGDSVSAWTEGDRSASAEAAGATADNGPRWATGETPEGFPTDVSPDDGEPVDRGAIMAALEAAAEAVVAAESAAESADQAEAAADAAETAAELVAKRSGGDDEREAEVDEALSAGVDAGEYDTDSLAERLASLLPGKADDADGAEQRTTQVVVTGLVSVASIASFKRHLGRLAGVQSVAVASGPEGEFVFNLTHRADLSFRDAIPTMPGFAARVTSTGDGVINVTARDPEAEG